MTSLVGKIGALGDNSHAPLYRQMQDALRRGIETGALGPREALPPERDIAAEFGMSRITVRKAIKGLVEDGLLISRHGAGTFVGGRVEKQFSMLTSFSEDMASRGRTARSEWIAQTESIVGSEESLALGLGPGSRVLRFNRIRFADDQPMAIEQSTIPGFGLPGLKSVGASLYAALDSAGHRPVRALQRLRAVLFDEQQALLLDVEVGAAGLFIERRGFLSDGRAIEMTKSWYRGDAYDFVAELNAQS